MARAQPLPGWSRVGSDRSGNSLWQNPKGETVSRRQYENAKAQEIGLKNWNAKQTFQKEVKNDSRYQRELAKAIEQGKSKKDFDKSYTRTFFRPDGSKKNRDRMSTKPDGPLARHLEKYGGRAPGAEYAVGETPSAEDDGDEGEDVYDYA